MVGAFVSKGADGTNQQPPLMGAWIQLHAAEGAPWLSPGSSGALGQEIGAG